MVDLLICLCPSVIHGRVYMVKHNPEVQTDSTNWPYTKRKSAILIPELRPLMEYIYIEPN